MTTILLTNATILVVAMLIMWLVSMRIRDVSFIDSFWALGMAMLAFSTYVQAEGAQRRMLLITGLVALWGLRLGIHLFVRWRAHGEDVRYAKLLKHWTEEKGLSWGRAALQNVFLMQGILLFIVCLPAQLGQLSPEPVGFGALGIVGTLIAVLGIVFETIGDAQLNRFKADPANSGKVLETGLWRYTRHPNYFGDCGLWWGIGLIAAETGPGRWGLIGPALLTFLLTRVSGAPMLERGLKKSRPDYEDYVRRTSGFIPLPPKR